MPTAKFFDLQRALTTNPEFNNKVQKLMQEIIKAEEAKNKEAMNHYMCELLRLCDYNASLLVPFFFPKFAGNKPMTLWSRPHAFSMMAIGAGNILTVQASRQIGKCLQGATALTTKDCDGKIKEETIGEIFENAKKCNKAPNK